MSKLTYYNNGNKEIRLSLEQEIPEGFIKGRLHPYSTTKNKQWYNNGKDEIFITRGDNIPVNYVKGRLPTREETREKLKESWKLNHRSSPNKGKHMSDEQKQKLSKAHRNKIYINNGKQSLFIDKSKILPAGYIQGKLLDKQSHENIRQQAIKRWQNFTKEEKDRISKCATAKGNETKRENGTFNSSKPEIDYYNYLKTIYDLKSIYRHYKSQLYPFYCDFYIKSEDKYIELNLHWTHGGRPYDPNDSECQEKLKVWQEKAKTSQFYKNAIETWTIRDVKKLKVAKENNLNIEIIYKL